MRYISDYQPDDDGQRECARAERCLDSRSVPNGDGTYITAGALGYRTFCDACRGHIVRCLEQMPGYYQDLREILGDKSAGHGERVSGSREHPIPLNVTVDSLMGELIASVHVWAARVAFTAGLKSVPETMPRAYVDAPFEGLCGMLAAHVDVLVSLEAAPMGVQISLVEADELPADADVIRHYDAGYAVLTDWRSGADAGLDLCRLNNRCRNVLGHTRADEPIEGRCFECGILGSLVRPDSSEGILDYARCRSCGTTYTGADYKMLLKAAYEDALAEQHRRAS